jgi:hypothetical protein
MPALQFYSTIILLLHVPEIFMSSSSHVATTCTEKTVPGSAPTGTGTCDARNAAILSETGLSSC